jgi:hypothetical protein
LLKSLYGLTGVTVGLFHEGASTAAISCRIDNGAKLTVSEAHGRTRFVEYRAFEIEAEAEDAA